MLGTIIGVIFALWLIILAMKGGAASCSSGGGGGTMLDLPTLRGHPRAFWIFIGIVVLLLWFVAPLSVWLTAVH